MKEKSGKLVRPDSERSHFRELKIADMCKSFNGLSAIVKNEAVDEVIEELTALLPELSEENRLVVESSILYMKNRIDQLHYADALAKGLPIGSGIIESAHRHLLQRRLKVPGAWILENAQNLAASRILRANEGLDAYWSTCPEEKAA